MEDSDSELLVGRARTASLQVLQNSDESSEEEVEETSPVKPPTKRNRSAAAAAASKAAAEEEEASQAAALKRIKEWPRLKQRLESAVWKVGKGFSKYTGSGSAAFSNLVICEDCVANGDLLLAETNYGASRSTSKVKQHYKHHHRPLWEKVVKLEAGVDAGPAGAKMTAHFRRADPSLEPLCQYFVMNYQPLSMVEDQFFRAMLRSFAPKASFPSEVLLYEQLFKQKVALEEEVEQMAVGQQQAITVDGWTSTANETYHSLTRHFIDDAFELVRLSLDCQLHEGTTTADALAESIIALAERVGVEPVDCVTDCEPSMVAAGRQLPFPHTGCTAHRLETITGSFFKAEGKLALGVKTVVAVAIAVLHVYSI